MTDFPYRSERHLMPGHISASGDGTDGSNAGVIGSRRWAFTPASVAATGWDEVKASILLY